MKKKLVMLYGLIAVVLFLAFGVYLRPTGVKETRTAAQAETVKQPAKSVQEFAERYRSADLTPSQRRLVEAGFYPDRIHSITIKTK